MGDANSWLNLLKPNAATRGWLAFYFKDTTFAATGKNTATVYLKMQAPDSVDQVYGKTVYTTYNQFAFSDYHVETKQDATVLTNSASVSMVFEPEEPDGGFELPKTGGTGTGPYAVPGSAMALLSGLVLLRRKRRGR